MFHSSSIGCGIFTQNSGIAMTLLNRPIMQPNQVIFLTLQAETMEYFIPLLALLTPPPPLPLASGDLSSSITLLSNPLFDMLNCEFTQTLVGAHPCPTWTSPIPHYYFRLFSTGLHLPLTQCGVGGLCTQVARGRQNQAMYIAMLISHLALPQSC